MAEEAIKVLVIEDEVSFAKLVRKVLQREGWIVDVVHTGQAALHAVAQQMPQLILLDYELPDMNGSQVMLALLRQYGKIPFIVMTAHSDERRVIEMLRIGATDYLIKDKRFLQVLPEVVRHVLANRRLTLQLESLEDNWETQSALFESWEEGVCYLDGQGNIRYCNPALLRFSQYGPAELVGSPFVKYVTPGYREQAWLNFSFARQGHTIGAHETAVCDRSGKVLLLQSRMLPVRLENDAYAVLILLQDLTAQKLAEQAVLRHRKVEELIINISTALTAYDKAFPVALQQVLQQIALFIGKCRYRVYFLPYQGIQLPEWQWCPELLQLEWFDRIYNHTIFTVPEWGCQCSRPCVMGTRFAEGETCYIVPLFLKETTFGFACFTFAPHKALFPEGIPSLLEVVGGIVSNALARYLSDQQLRTSERKLSALLEQSSDGIFTFDAQSWQVRECNQRMCQLLGYSKAELLSLTVDRFIAEPRPEIEANVKLVLQSGTAFLGVRRYCSKQGQLLDVEISASRVVYNKQQVIMVNMRDYSEKQQLEMRLMQAQKLEAIGTLAGGIAHDFNNILSAILGYSELAAGRLPLGTPQEELQEVIKAALRAKELVAQILTFSRQESSERKVLEVQALVQEIVKLLRALLPSTIEVQLELSDTLLYVQGDRSQLYQLLMNLCVNAEAAMREQGGVLTLRATAGRLPAELHGSVPNGEYVGIQVADSGCGMEPAVQKRIFEPFFTTKRPGEGTGMGLSVVHGIVKAHGGDIEVVSKPGQGSVFTIWLPLVAVDAAGMALETAEDAWPVVSAAHILFVDDDPALTQMGERVLTQAGYQVTSVIGGRAALAAFEAEPAVYDVVVSDLTMPDLTGHQLAAAIQGIRPHTPIILCSGYRHHLNEEQIAELGICAFLTKPIRTVEYVQAIEAALRQNGQLVTARPMATPSSTQPSAATRSATERSYVLQGMLAGLLHEINQPLNVMTLAVDAVLYWEKRGRAAAPEKLMTVVQDVKQQLARLDGIVKYAARFLHKQPEVSKPCLLADVLQRVARFALSRLTAHRCQLEVVTEWAEAEVITSEVYLEEMLLLLLFYLMESMEGVPGSRVIRIGPLLEKNGLQIQCTPLQDETIISRLQQIGESYQPLVGQQLEVQTLPDGLSVWLYWQ